MPRVPPMAHVEVMQKHRGIKLANLQPRYTPLQLLRQTPNCNLPAQQKKK